MLPTKNAAHILIIVVSLVFWTACGTDSPDVADPMDTTHPTQEPTDINGKVRISDAVHHQSLSSSKVGTTVYFEDFEAGPAGWTPVDFTAPTGVFWHREPHPEAVLPRDGVAALSTDDPCFATPPGYGRDWDQRLTRKYALRKKVPVQMSYLVAFDNEPEYDFLTLEVSEDDGASWIVLDTMNGKSAGFQLRSVDLSAYAGMSVQLSFHFTSDLGWDDEDGIWDTTGMFIDRVTVDGKTTEFNWSEPRPDDDPTDLDGWKATAAPAVGLPPFRLETYLAGIGDGSNTAWAAYDPATNIFPLSPPDRAFSFGIESSLIPIPADRNALVLSFDVYRDLPIFGWMFFSWEVGALVDGCLEYHNHGFVYYGTVGWDRVSFEIQDGAVCSPTGATCSGVPPEATEIAIRLKVSDWSQLFGEYPAPHTAAPFFDNVEISTAP